MSMMRGFGLFRLCGVYGGVKVRDGLSFSILKVDDEKEKGYAKRQLGCQEGRTLSRDFAWPRLEQLYCGPPFVNRLRLNLSIGLHPIQPEVPHQRLFRRSDLHPGTQRGARVSRSARNIADVASQHA
jgi:hypothetical protein